MQTKNAIVIESTIVLQIRVGMVFVLKTNEISSSLVVSLRLLYYHLGPKFAVYRVKDARFEVQSLSRLSTEFNRYLIQYILVSKSHYFICIETIVTFNFAVSV